VIVVAFSAVGNTDLVDKITKEDGIFENLSALFYLFGFLICGFLIFKRGRQAFLVIWCILCFFFLGEETSWFQRIFDYSVPMVENHNEQDEFNLHNLDLLYEEPMVTEDGEFQFSLSALLKPQNLMKLGFFSYFLMIPLLHLVPKFERFCSVLGYPKPPLAFLLTIWPPLLLSYIFTFLYNQSNHGIVETREMLYALFILLYIVAVFLPADHKYNSNTQKSYAAKEVN